MLHPLLLCGNREFRCALGGGALSGIILRSRENLKPFCWNRDNARMGGFSHVVDGEMRDQWHRNTATTGASNHPCEKLCR